MYHVLGIIKKVIADTLIGLGTFLSIDPKKSASSSSWYENRIPEISYSRGSTSSRFLEYTQPDWQTVDKVDYSGVSIVSKAKVVMFEHPPSSNYHPEDRGAIVCTAYYRPFKYPHSRVVDCTFKFMSHFFKTFKRRKKGDVSGSVALLGNQVYCNTNYYHFWADVIADAWYISKHIKNSEQPDYYLVPFAGLDWQWDILRLCGLRDDQVIPYSRYDLLSLEELIIPVRDKGSVNLPSWLSTAIHQMSGWSPKTVKGTRLIFVSRADATRRRVVNEVDIRERLVQEGFEVYTLDGLNFREQQALFSSAAIICAPHGAALTNLMWCGPGTVVIDLLSEKHLVPCFKELAEQTQVIYYPCICKNVGNGDTGLEGDIMVSDYQVEFVLDIIAKHLSLSNNIFAASVALEDLTQKTDL